MGRVLHDRDHGDHGRLQGSAPDAPRGEAVDDRGPRRGVGTLFYTAHAVMALVVEGGLHRGSERRRKRMLDELTNHFIICGYGRIGSIIADEFAARACPTWSSIATRSACTR